MGYDRALRSEVVLVGADGVVHKMCERWVIDMSPSEDGGVASAMVLSQAARVRKIVENGDYSKCPIGGQKDVNLFMVDGITAIIEQQTKGSSRSWLTGTVGGGVGAVLAGAIYVTGKLHGWW